MSDPVVLINILKCEPERQDALMERLGVLVRRQRELEGFVSATLHRGLNGRTAVNYAVWASREDWKAMGKHPTIVAAMEPIMGLATFEPNLYDPGEVVE